MLIKLYMIRYRYHEINEVISYLSINIYINIYIYIYIIIIINIIINNIYINNTLTMNSYVRPIFDLKPGPYKSGISLYGQLSRYHIKRV